MYKEYYECTEKEQEIIKDTLSILTNSKWIEDSFCNKYLYLIGHEKVVDMQKKKEKK